MCWIWMLSVKSAYSADMKEKGNTLKEVGRLQYELRKLLIYFVRKDSLDMCNTC